VLPCRRIRGLCISHAEGSYFKTISTPQSGLTSAIPPQVIGPVWLPLVDETNYCTGRCLPGLPGLEITATSFLHYWHTRGWGVLKGNHASFGRSKVGLKKARASVYNKQLLLFWKWFRLSKKGEKGSFYVFGGLSKLLCLMKHVLCMEPWVGADVRDS
jgi:hypothetical protein